MLFESASPRSRPQPQRTGAAPSARGGRNRTHCVRVPEIYVYGRHHHARFKGDQIQRRVRQASNQRRMRVTPIRTDRVAAYGLAAHRREDPWQESLSRGATTLARVRPRGPFPNPKNFHSQRGPSGRRCGLWFKDGPPMTRRASAAVVANAGTTMASSSDDPGQDRDRRPGSRARAAA